MRVDSRFRFQPHSYSGQHFRLELGAKRLTRRINSFLLLLRLNLVSASTIRGDD